MFEIVINEKGGSKRSENFDKSEITIGRVQGNDVVLPKGNISKRHSRIVLKDGKFIIVDLKSTNGTYVNGKKITAPQVVKATDKIYIGDFTLQLATNNGAALAPEPAAARPPKSPDVDVDLFGDGDAPDAVPAEAAPPGLIDDNFDQEFDHAEHDARPAKDAKAPMGVAKPTERHAAVSGVAVPLVEDPLAPDLGAGSPSADLPPLGRKMPSRQTPSRMRPLPTRKPSIDGVPDADGILGRDAAPAADASMDIAGPYTGTGERPLERADAIRLVHREIVDALGVRFMHPSQFRDCRPNALEIARNAASRLRAIGRLHPRESAEDIATEAASVALDLGLLEDLMADDAVVEIAVTATREIWADREGHLEPTGRIIATERDVLNLIHQLRVLGGRDPSAADEALTDVRLFDGSRVVAAIPPLAFRGATLSVRKASRDAFTLEKLLEYSTISRPMMTFLDWCVRFRRGILVSVGAGVNASATLNALAVGMPDDDRIVTIEDGVELHLGPLRNATTLEVRGGVTLDQLVAHAVAMQADRVVVGNLVGPGTVTVLRAVSGPLEGSIAAYSAPTPSDALDRLLRIELSGTLSGCRDAAAPLIAAAFPVVIQESRFQDNSRRITVVSEVRVSEVGELIAHDIFRFVPEGVDDQGIVTGSFAATGYVPQFLEVLMARGEAADVDLAIFNA